MRSKARTLDLYEELFFAPLPVCPAGHERYGLRLWVRVRHVWLDSLLARGASPGASHCLTLRARQLTSRAVRARLATRVGTILRGSNWRQRWGLTIAPESACVKAARTELQAIAEMLAGESPVYARGVAMTMELLGSAESALFDPREAESAWDSAQLSLSALRGHL